MINFSMLFAAHLAMSSVHGKQGFLMKTADHFLHSRSKTTSSSNCCANVLLCRLRKSQRERFCLVEWVSKWIATSRVFAFACPCCLHSK